jgi:hypothetical protein
LSFIEPNFESSIELLSQSKTQDLLLTHFYVNLAVAVAVADLAVAVAVADLAHHSLAVAADLAHLAVAADLGGYLAFAALAADLAAGLALSQFHQRKTYKIFHIHIARRISAIFSTHKKTFVQKFIHKMLMELTPG